MKQFILLVLALLGGFIWLKAQYSEVIYDEITQSSNTTRSSEYCLRIDTKASHYFRTKTQTQRTVNENIEERNKGVIPFVSKSFSEKKITYNQTSINKIYTVSEAMPLQRWQMGHETKKVGNYLYKKATAQFRGRTYTAWYTEELPVMGGPWKFDGLPGMIMEVASNDGYLSIKARTITRKAGSLPPAPYEINFASTITWADYCKQTLALIKRWEKAIAAQGEPGDEYKVAFEMIEDIGIKEITVSK